MSLSSHEAQASLAEAAQAGRRSAQLYAYSKASPYLVMWGIIWVLGYGGTGLSPHNADLIWGVLIVAGLLGGAYIGSRSKSCSPSGARSPYVLRITGVGLIAVFFVAASYTIMWPVNGAQVTAYPALITGTVYAAVGLWAGLRYVVTGLLVVGLTLFGFFAIHDIWYLYWMAVVGGGSMILAGFWFRTA
jgi:hypothetical protein